MGRILKSYKINIHKTIAAIIFLNISEIVTLVLAVIYNFTLNSTYKVRLQFSNERYLIYVIILMVLLNSIITIKYVFILIKENGSFQTIQASLEQTENLNNTLRAQRHDFMNHLQVVYSLMEMSEYKEAQDYIDKVYSDIQSVNRVLKTSNPAVNALLQAKIIHAEKLGIQVKLNITTRLENLKIKSWEFCRILGNIIDNAIYSLKDMDGDKLILVEFYEDLKGYGFRIRNNGPKIPDDIQDKILQPGFTTKCNEGEGMGLAIVYGILKEAEGTFGFTSSDNETVFEGFIPR